ncbi:MAG TPA: histone deacetylase [Solirubrobacteraceae bacterium]|jgi:acetoin utilization deacetylase AcuC-like enzyme|nr:histone deacetylase [Solirubrobacteraceae bacterium]
MSAMPSRPPLYFHHPLCLEHDPSAYIPAHPDTPERLLVLEAELRARDWLGFERREAPAASEHELGLVHTPALIDSIRALGQAGGGPVDSDTYVGELSYRAALHAAGGACAAVRALLAGETRLAFAGVRPSGHHAEPGRAMGFCLFNNVAVAAALAIAELGARRVFVLDWDVHHGNGTAEAFRRRSDVLFASIHQSPLYPGTGALSDVGSGAGEGYTINLPVPPGSEEDLWLSLLEHVIVPAASAFDPDLVLVSAGFDAHREDPLASARLETESFAELARHVRALAQAADAPVGVVLEGGYAPGAMAASAAAALQAFAGEQEPRSAAPEALLTSRAAAQFGHYWPL